MSEYIISFDIQVEIMKRIPIKSLIQLRSVSKQWKSFIDGLELIAGYGIDHSQVHRLLVRYQHQLNGQEISVSCVDSDDDDTPKFLFTHTVPVLPKPLEELTTIGSSHGLLCLYGDYRDPGDSFYKEMVVLWNPLIRKSVGIDIDVPDSPYETETVVGFGVCSVTKDPKLVKITFTEFQSNSISWQVEVFTLSSGKWRNISSSNLPRGSIVFTMSQVVIDGIIYWLAYDRIPIADDDEFRTCNLIISFDITSEKFGVLDLPEQLSLKTLSISKLKESLVVLEYNIDTGRQAWGVWVMEHGVPNSFTKLYTINAPNQSIKTVPGFTNSGAPIIQIEDDNYLMSGALFVFDPDSGHISEIGIYGAENSFVVNTYTETLLLLGH